MAGVVTVAVAMLLTAVAGYAFARGQAAPTAAATPGGRAATPARPPAEPTRGAGRPTAAHPPALAGLPPACEIIPGEVVRRLVPTPAPKIDKMGTETAGECEHSMSQGGTYRAVRVDARAFLPRYLHERAANLTVWSYESQWRQAHEDVTSDTSSLRRLDGLGDAAFERFWVDPDLRNAVGEATVRYRNVILTVRYTEQQPSAADRAASEQRCLTNAVAAAKAALGKLS